MAEVGRAECWGGAVILEGPGMSQEVLRCPPAKEEEISCELIVLYAYSNRDNLPQNQIHRHYYTTHAWAPNTTPCPSQLVYHTIVVCVYVAYSMCHRRVHTACHTCRLGEMEKKGMNDERTGKQYKRKIL